MWRIDRERPSYAEDRALDCLVHGLAHVVAAYGLEDGQKVAARAVLLLGDVDGEAGVEVHGSAPATVLAGASGSPQQQDDAGTSRRPRTA